MPFTYLIIGLMLASLVLMQINLRLASLVLSIIDRWLRWFVISFGAAQLVREFGWVDRP